MTVLGDGFRSWRKKKKKKKLDKKKKRKKNGRRGFREVDEPRADWVRTRSQPSTSFGTQVLERVPHSTGGSVTGRPSTRPALSAQVVEIIVPRLTTTHCGNVDESSSSSSSSSSSTSSSSSSSSRGRHERSLHQDDFDSAEWERHRLFSVSGKSENSRRDAG